MPDDDTPSEPALPPFSDAPAPAEPPLARPPGPPVGEEAREGGTEDATDDGSPEDSTETDTWGADADRHAEAEAGTPTERDRASRVTRRALEWAGLVALALVVAFLLRTFVVQSFYIPSTSMAPTLEVGDRVLVNKLAYRFGDPHRGDVIVFEAPPGEANGEVKDLIKRVIALPGETVEGRDGHVYIDDELLAEPWLPEGMTARTFGPETIPEDHYWVLGDNRFDSRDSTFFKSIPRDSIVGKAFVRIWPLDNLGGL